MVNKLGIKINLNEAQVLVCSADHSETQSLHLDEFMELIFNDNDALNVDLSNLPG